jgi:HD-like signal output (HDOD) protein
VLGCDHATVGRFLCEHWSLPIDYRVAIAAHHDLDQADEAHRPWAALVHCADIMARALLIGSGGDHGIPILDKRALGLLGLDENRFDDLFAAAETELGRAEVFFTILNDRS